MGLKNCPDCNLMLFDTDTECIYCGWKHKEQTIETPAEVLEDKILEANDVTVPETKNVPQAQAIEENIEHEETVVDAKKQAVAELKDIKKSFDAVLNAAHKNIAEQQLDVEDTIFDETVDIEDTIEDEESFFTEDDYNRGIRYLDGKRFNLFDIIEGHGAANKVQIIKEIRDVTGTSLKNAVKVLDDALDDFIEYQRKNYIEYDVSAQSIHSDSKKADSIEPLINSVQGNIHRALAYNMIIRKGPDRKAQIIDELMRSVHISLPQATEAVEHALKEYRENTK